MMLVNADTMESPVTTVHRIAPKAAAAMVPMAFSKVWSYTDQHARRLNRQLVIDGGHRRHPRHQLETDWHCPTVDKAGRRPHVCVPGRWDLRTARQGSAWHL